MAHWIPFPGNRSGVEDWKTFNMLVATFMDVFPFVYGQQGYRGVGLHVLGSMDPILISPDQARRRMGSETVRKDITEWDPVPLSHVLGIKRIDSDTQAIPRVTDDRPRLEFYLLTTWAEDGRKALAYYYW